MAHFTRDLRLLYVSILLWGFGYSLFIYVQPLYVAYLGASPTQIGVAFGLGGALGLLLFIPVAQRADRLGRKRIIVAGWALGLVATAAMAAAPDWRWLIPALAVYQLSSAAMPAFLGYVAAARAEGNPSQTFAMLWSGAYIGSVLAPAVGGWIADGLGLRALYGTAAVIFALSTAVIALIRDQPAILPELRIRPRQLLVNRAFRRQMLFVFLLFFAIDIGQVMVPNYLQEVRGFSLRQIGLLGSLGSIGVVLLALALSRYAPERRAPIFVTQLVILAALLLWLSTTLPLFVALAYLIHGRNRLAQPFIDGRLSRILRAQELNLGYGFREVAMRLGLAVSPYAAGLLYSVRPSWPLRAGIVCLTVSLCLTLFLPRTLPPPVQPAGAGGDR